MAREDFRKRLDRVEEEKLATREQLREGASVTSSGPASRSRFADRRGRLRQVVEEHPSATMFLVGFALVWGLAGIALVVGHIPSLEESWVATESRNAAVVLTFVGIVGVLVMQVVENIEFMFNSERLSVRFSPPTAFFVGLVAAAYLAVAVQDRVKDYLPEPEPKRFWEFWK